MKMHKLQSLLKDCLYLNLSTVSVDGQPRGSPLFFVYDSENRMLYWWSSKNSQHSKNIKFNPNCFITIFDSHDEEGEGAAIYLRCRAAQLGSKKDIQFAIKLYNQKANSFKLSLSSCSGEAPTRMHGCQVLESWVNKDAKDETGNSYDTRERLSLSSIC